MSYFYFPNNWEINLPRADNLFLDNVVVVNASGFGIEGFSRRYIQAYVLVQSRRLLLQLDDRVLRIEATVDG